MVTSLAPLPKSREQVWSETFFTTMSMVKPCPTGATWRAITTDRRIAESSQVPFALDPLVTCGLGDSLTGFVAEAEGDALGVEDTAGVATELSLVPAKTLNPPTMRRTAVTNTRIRRRQ